MKDRCLQLLLSSALLISRLCGASVCPYELDIDVFNSDMGILPFLASGFADLSRLLVDSLRPQDGRPTIGWEEEPKDIFAFVVLSTCFKGL